MRSVLSCKNCWRLKDKKWVIVTFFLNASKIGTSFTVHLVIRTEHPVLAFGSQRTAFYKEQFVKFKITFVLRCFGVCIGAVNLALLALDDLKLSFGSLSSCLSISCSQWGLSYIGISQWLSRI